MKAKDISLIRGTDQGRDENVALIQVMEKERSEYIFNSGVWEISQNFVLHFLES